MTWIFLVGAIMAEVTGTLSLRKAALAERRWYAVVAIGYVLALVLLAAALGAGLGLGVAYGIWAAAGIALTAVLSRLLFNEPLTMLVGVGIGIVIVGVFLVEFGAAH